MIPTTYLITHEGEVKAALDTHCPSEANSGHQKWDDYNLASMFTTE